MLRASRVRILALTDNLISTVAEQMRVGYRVRACCPRYQPTADLRSLIARGIANVPFALIAPAFRRQCGQSGKFTHTSRSEVYA